ncbi:MAG TPA: Ig-like domain-containing protein [Armatimonadota bacterium]|jgi:alpha-tubulin suppressor-like RCC1 family protein
MAMSVETTLNKPVPITLGTVGAGQATVTFVITRQPLHGTLTGATPNLVYTPANDYSGLDLFRYRCRSGGQESPEARVLITVWQVAPIESGTVWGLGSGALGQFGTGDQTSGFNDWRRVMQPNGGPPLADVVSLYATDDTSFAVRADGTVWTCGASPYACYGDPAPPLSLFPTRMEGLDRVVKLAAVPGWGLALSGDGHVTQWGNTHTWPSLGQPVTTPNGVDLPVAIQDVATLSAVHRALGTDGVLWNWHADGGSPARVPSVAGLCDLTQAFAIGSDGTAWDMLNLTTLDSPPPTPTAYLKTVGLPDVIWANDAAGSCLVQREDGTVWHLGSNVFGTQYGGPTLNKPELIPELDHVVRLAGSTAYGAAIKSDGSLWLWGWYPGHWQAESGGRPRRVEALSRVRSVAVAAARVLAVAAADPGHMPVAADLSVGTRSLPVAIALFASDADGDALSYSVVTPPAHGNLTGSAPNLVYTPVPGYLGTDSFTYQASDGLLLSSPATVSIRVASRNRSPRAYARFYMTADGRPLRLTLSTTDPDGDAVTCAIVQPPKQGTMSQAGPLWIYRPKAGFLGTDSFTFKATDGALTSSIVTAHITVVPATAALAWGANQNGQVGDGTRVDRLFPVPITGSEDLVSLACGTGFTVGLTSAGTVKLWGTPRAITVPTLVPGLKDCVCLAASASHCLAVKSDGSVWAWRPEGLPAPTVDPLGVGAVPAPVFGLSGIVAVATSATHSLALRSDGTVWAWGASEWGQCGTARPIAPPAAVPGINGVTQIAAGKACSLALRSDGTVWGWGWSNDRLLGAGQTSPVAVPTQLSTPIDLVDLVATTSYALGYRASTGPLLWGSFQSTFTSPDASLGSWQLGAMSAAEDYYLLSTASGDTYARGANDRGRLGIGSRGTGLILWPVLTHADIYALSAGKDHAAAVGAYRPNVPPSVQDVAARTHMGQPVTIEMPGTDSEVDSLTYSILSGPSHGTTTTVGARVGWVYTPDAGYLGTDQFTVRATDGIDWSGSATVTVTVAPPNTKPQVRDVAMTLARNSAARVGLLGSDSEGDPLTYAISAASTLGKILRVGSDGFVYVAPPGFEGSDSFAYTASDGELTSAQGRVTVRVVGAEPLVVIDSARTASGQSASLPVRLTASATNVSGLDLRLRVATTMGAPAPLSAALLPGPQASGWTVQSDPTDALHVAATTKVPGAGPQQPLSLALAVDPKAPSGSQYVIYAESLHVDDQTPSGVSDLLRVVPGTVTVGPCLVGDANDDGSISVADVVGALRQAVGISAPGSGCGIHASDVDCDGKVTVADVTLLLKRVLLGQALPCG